ncbi:LamB/YcsF family protein [Paenibacillus sp. NPDC058174]|uniref:LamB/YcsF family protein n=1 Tax=Paenibacillus sp. NPDC058174 TaxID=3346366 RepID=UPI0036DCBE92
MIVNGKSVDLNCDFGEGYGAYSFGQDAELLKYITSVNIACGFHAGDPHTMRRAVEMSLAAGAAIGAHPGLPDRLGFGRREMAVTPEEAYDFTVYQIGALSAFVRAAGGRLQHVKPHGALYHMANSNSAIAEAIVRAAAATGDSLMIYGQSGSLLLEAAQREGLAVASEVFADRGYERDSSLMARSKPGALIADVKQAAEHAVAMVKNGYALTVDGEKAPVQADTICLHGDGPHAVQFASQIREALLKADIRVEALGKK